MLVTIKLDWEWAVFLRGSMRPIVIATASCRMAMGAWVEVTAWRSDYLSTLGNKAVAKAEQSPC